MEDPGAAERLWLEALQQVAARAAHELKGALNGVSVNLEVVRGRAAHGEHPAAAVARFAESAASQLDVVIEMNEALLALARRPRVPVDVGGTLRHLAALLVPVGAAAGTPIVVVAEVAGLAAGVTAPAAVVRTVLAQALMALLDTGGGRVELVTGPDATTVMVAASGGAIALDAATVAAAAGAGVDMTAAGPNLTLTFPAAPPPAPAGARTHGTA